MAVGLGMAGHKAIDKAYPDVLREDNAQKALARSSTEEGGERVGYEPGEADEWLNEAKATWTEEPVE